MSIKKIAEMTGVSTATVSRILNDPDYQCRLPETREAVLKAVQELHYVPNQAARNLKMNMASDKPAFCLRILVTRAEAAGQEPFFDEMIPFLESEIHKNGSIYSGICYEAVFSDERKCQRADLTEIAERMKAESENTDGLIILGKCCKKALEIIKKYYKNIVAVTRNTTGYQVDEVLCDGKKMAELAMEHLIRLGHQKIAYLGECHNESRYQGYQETLFRYHLEQNIDFIIETDSDGVPEALERLLEKEELPSGIYCASDKIAAKVVAFLNGRKDTYYFPSIVSNDDTQAAQYTSPMLTTVQLPKEDMARFALYLLLDRLKGGHKNTVRIEMEGKLIIRSSCSGEEEFGTCEYYI